MTRLIALLLIVCATLVALPSSTPAQNETKSAVSTNLHERRVAYRDELLKVVAVMRKRYQDGQDSVDGLVKAQIELGYAELAVTSEPEKRIEKLQATLDMLKEIETLNEGRIQAGMGRVDELHKSAAGRILVEIMLLEEQQRQSR